LIDAIVNVRRELGFFEDVAAQYNLTLELPSAEMVSDGVKGYRKLFEDVGTAVEKGECGVWEGMVVLWGTEKVRLSTAYHLTIYPLKKLGAGPEITSLIGG
jgi:hypothetical protein